MRLVLLLAFVLPMVMESAAHASPVSYGFTAIAWPYTSPELASIYPYDSHDVAVGQLTLDDSIHAIGSATYSEFPSAVSGSMVAGGNTVTFAGVSPIVQSFVGQPATITIGGATNGSTLTQSFNTGSDLTFGAFSIQLYASQVLPSDADLSVVLAGPQPYTYGFVNLDYQVNTEDPSMSHYASVSWYITSFHEISPIPEPTAVSLMSAGLIAVHFLGVRRRRHRDIAKRLN